MSDLFRYHLSVNINGTWHKAEVNEGKVSFFDWQNRDKWARKLTKEECDAAIADMMNGPCVLEIQASEEWTDDKHNNHSKSYFRWKSPAKLRDEASDVPHYAMQVYLRNPTPENEAKLFDAIAEFTGKYGASS